MAPFNRKCSIPVNLFTQIRPGKAQTIYKIQLEYILPISTGLSCILELIATKCTTLIPCSECQCTINWSKQLVCAVTELSIHY